MGPEENLVSRTACLRALLIQSTMFKIQFQAVAETGVKLAATLSTLTGHTTTASGFTNAVNGVSGAVDMALGAQYEQVMHEVAALLNEHLQVGEYIQRRKKLEESLEATIEPDLRDRTRQVRDTWYAMSDLGVVGRRGGEGGFAAHHRTHD